MPTLTLQELETLLTPYLEPPPGLLPQLSAYLDLLLEWNARTNLTAIRDPRRHRPSALRREPLHRPRISRADAHTLLDYGSGAGFPGLPIALLLPHLTVTLAESQGKKATFLREAIRTLNLPESRAAPATQPRSGPAASKPSHPISASTSSPCVPSTRWIVPFPSPASA